MNNEPLTTGNTEGQTAPRLSPVDRSPLTVYLQIVSPKGTLYEGDLQYAVLPGRAGAFAVYPAHAPLIAALAAGGIKCVAGEGKEETIAISGGFAEVNNNKITVCVETS